jgi:hypothetical protein
MCAGFWLLALSLSLFCFGCLVLLESRVIVTVIYSLIFTAMFSMKLILSLRRGAFYISISAEVLFATLKGKFTCTALRAVFQKEKAKKAKSKKKKRPDLHTNKLVIC